MHKQKGNFCKHSRTSLLCKHIQFCNNLFLAKCLEKNEDEAVKSSFVLLHLLVCQRQPDAIFRKLVFPFFFWRSGIFYCLFKQKLKKKISICKWDWIRSNKIWSNHLKADMLIEAWIMSHVWSIKIFLCLDIRNFRRQLFQMGFEYKWCHMMLKTKSGNHRQKVMVMFLMHGRVVQSFTKWYKIHRLYLILSLLCILFRYVLVKWNFWRLDYNPCCRASNSSSSSLNREKKFATGLYTDDLESIGPMTTYYASCMRIGG